MAQNTPTIAEQIAARFPDGQQFDNAAGESLSEVCAAAGRIQYGQRNRETDTVEVVNPGDHFSGDPIRYEFKDGSAIVEAGDAWDVEIPGQPFSWQCEGGR